MTTAIRFNRRQLEEHIVDCRQRLCTAGWVSSTDGHMTVRVSDDRFLTTPLHRSPACFTRDDLLVVDNAGACIGCEATPFDGIQRHLFILRQRPEVRAVLQARPVASMGLSVAGHAIQSTMLADAVLALGDTIPVIPYTHSTDEMLHALTSCLYQHDAFIFEHHGILAVGADLYTAFSRLELIEQVAQIQLTAMHVGGARLLSRSHVEELLARRHHSTQSLRHCDVVKEIPDGLLGAASEPLSSSDMMTPSAAIRRAMAV